MDHATLKGRTILVVEDQPIIALEIVAALQKVGAEVTTTTTLRQAVILVEHDGLAAAILDHALPDGDASLLCTRLKERDIPFVLYSGYSQLEGACRGALVVPKPSSMATLVAAVEQLVRGR